MSLRGILWGLALSAFLWLMVGVLILGTVHAEEVTPRQEYVRVTFYDLPGRMADGQMVHDGAAACSAWLPMGTVLEFPDGRQVVCQDRGHGDWYWRGWVDVWTPNYAAGVVGVERAYGLYSWVSIVRWGWDG